MKTTFYKLRFSISLLCWAIIFSLSNQVFSQATDLHFDQSFGEDGIVFIPENMQTLDMIEYDNAENIIAVGISTKENSEKQISIVKLNKDDGSIDNGFGTNGIVNIDCSANAKIRRLSIKEDNTICLITSHTVGALIKFKVHNFTANGNLGTLIESPDEFELSIDSVDLNIAYFSDDYLIICGNSILYKFNYLGELFHNFGTDGQTDLFNGLYNMTYIRVRKIFLMSDNIIIAGKAKSNNFTYSYHTFHIALNGDGTFKGDGYGVWTIDIYPPYMGLIVPADAEDDDVANIFFAPPYEHVIVGGKFHYPPYELRRIFMIKFLMDLPLQFYNGFELPFHATRLPVVIFNNSYFLSGRDGKIANFTNDLIVNVNFADSAIYTLPENIRYNDIKLHDTDKLLIAGYDNTSGSNKAMIARLVIEQDYSITNEIISQSFSFYPNPASNILHFSSAQSFEIIDIQGRILKQSATEQDFVDISELKNGMYFIKLDNRLYKFVKN